MRHRDLQDVDQNQDVRQGRRGEHQDQDGNQLRHQDVRHLEKRDHLEEVG